MSEGWQKYWGDEANLDRWKRPQAEVLAFIETLDPAEKPAVLDLGCGIGRHAIAFAEAGFDVTATDASEKAIERLCEWCKARELKVKSRVCDVFECGFDAESFDVVLAWNVIYHNYRERFTAAIDHVRRLLEPGGLFLFTCPARDDGKYGYGEEIAPHTFRTTKSINPGEIHYFCDEADLDEMLARFEIVSRDKQEHWWEREGQRQFHSYWVVIARRP